MSIDIDRSSDFGARVLRRLAEESTVWLTTTGKDGHAQPNPVWFLWTGDRFRIFSAPDHKVGNIERSGEATLNFNTAADGEDVVVFTGVATVGEAADLLPTERAAYVDKYRAAMRAMKLDLDTFNQTYSKLITVSPTRLRGY